MITSRFRIIIDNTIVEKKLDLRKGHHACTDTFTNKNLLRKHIETHIMFLDWKRHLVKLMEIKYATC